MRLCPPSVLEPLTPMVAFRPTPVSELKTPQTREEFVEVFGEGLVRQAERLFMDALNIVHLNRAFFREKDLVDQADRLAQEELKDQPKVVRSPHFDSLLRWIFQSQPWVKLDARGTVTTQEMWDKEQQMLGMAGEEDSSHILPPAVVNEALASRSWIDPKSLPSDLLEHIRQTHPRATSGGLESRLVVSAATQLGYECYGVDLAWNRPAVSSLEASALGTAAEFVGAIQADRAAGNDWFIKPVLFLADDWSTPQAQALKQAAQNARQPVVFATRSGISDEQVKAVVVATQDKRRVAVIEGTAGAGKSFTMKSVYEAYLAMGYDVIGTALGWSAAKVLSGSTGLPKKSCRAMKGLLNAMRRSQKSGTAFFTRPTLIIVDEAGMVGTRYMHELLWLTRSSTVPIKIVLTGDSLQVDPVEAGNALEAIIRYHGTTRIDTIRRQKQESHRLAVRRFSKGEAGKALYPFVHQESIRWAADKEALFNQVVRDFVSYRQAYPDKKALVLAYTNRDVNELNQRIRQVYKKTGLVGAEEVALDVTDGRVSWRAAFAVGDEVVMRANDQELPTYHIPPSGHRDPLDESTWEFKTTGVFNRNAGKIVGIRYSDNPRGSVDFIVDLEGDDPARVIVNSKRFKANKPGMPMVHNFATTIYASQGMTVDNVLMIDHEKLNCRLAYVGMSRHTENVTIYLNETDLHLRLDRMMGKSPSQRTQGIHPDRIGAQTRRYSRTQMLQAVALSWGKVSENLTATIYKERQKFEKAKPEDTDAERARVRPGSPAEPVVDFLPESNQAYPLVDVEHVLGLPDPIAQAEFVRPSDAEENRSAVSVHESPVVIEPAPPASAPPRQQNSGVLARALGWVRRLGEEPPSGKPAAPSKPATASRYAKPQGTFRSRDGRSVSAPVDGPAHVPVPTRTGGWFARKPTPSGLPLLPVPTPIGTVSAEGVLRFDNVPQTLAPSDGSAVPSPSDAFLASETARQWWALGRHQEPRILARNARGEVVARYALDGRCTVGDGFPPIAYAPQPSPETPIHIVPGAREWFLLQELYQKKFEGSPEKRPHVIWGAQDVDWKPVAPGMQKRQVVIMRSKHDEGQLPWALSVEKELRQRWGVLATIAPKPPVQEAEMRCSGQRPAPRAR